MANDNSASTPEFWAVEALRVLFQMVPTLGFVHREFTSALATQGDTFNTYRPQTRTTRRKTMTDDYTVNDANLDPVAIPLDQYFFDAFMIYDEELSKSNNNLVATHLTPAMQTIARGVNRLLLGELVTAGLHQGSPNKRAGRIGQLSKTNASDYILEAEQALITNLAPPGLRTAIVHETANTKLMGTTEFQRADARGISPTIQTGEVGRVYNTLFAVSQDTPYVNADLADTQVAGTVNNSGGYLAGHSATMTVTDPGTDWTVGEYATIAGNDQPTFITVSSAATDITLNEALKYDVADGAVITHFLKCTNEATERAAGYQKEMTFTHTSGKNLQAGQMISFGTGASRHTYHIIEVSATAATTTTVLLSRPLDATVASGADAFPGPGGSYNPVWHREALTFVSRPMRAVTSMEDNARSAVINFEGVGLRVTTQYRITKGGRQVNIDLLCGAKALNNDLATVMIG